MVGVGMMEAARVKTARRRRVKSEDSCDGIKKTKLHRLNCF